MTAPREAMVQTIDVWKEYADGHVQAVQGANMAVYPGEIAAVLGPSGSGKTTLLQMLGTMISPSQGEIRLAGESLAGMTLADKTILRRHKVGFVFQHFNLFSGLTALENVMMVLRLQGEMDGRKKAQEALESVRLGERMHFYPRQLSGGQRQRIAIARAIVHRPKVILADEPTGSLDSENGLQVMLLLTALAREAGAAVVVVTHDLRVKMLAQRTFLMEDGKLRDGTGVWTPSWNDQLAAKGGG
jgi:putative ABC transport system ATP-binding protein